MPGIVLHTFLCFGIFIWRSLGSDITTFSDDKCRTSVNNLDTVNGYPDGVCTQLEITGNLKTFQIAKLDPGCAVTLYGQNDSSGLNCSSELKIVAELATCYNSSWVYYSIDGCLPPGPSSIILPSITPTSSSSSSSSSAFPISPSTSSIASPTATPSTTQNSTSPGAIIGAVIGSISACAILLGAVFLCLRRRKQNAKPLPTPPSYELSQEHALIEASRGSIAELARIHHKEMWAHDAAVEIGRNSYAAPVELPAQSFGDKKGTSSLIHVHMEQ